jgi:hypothetical protein
MNSVRASFVTMDWALLNAAATREAACGVPIERERKYVLTATSTYVRRGKSTNSILTTITWCIHV